MRRIDEIILHCSATEAGKNYGVKDIDRWHRQRGFKMVGYHYVICLDGTIEVGRSLAEVGAHCTGRNRHSIGICYIGGLSHGLPTNTLTMPQLTSLSNLLRHLMSKYNLSWKQIRLHNEFAQKACPCFRRGYLTGVIRDIVENCGNDD